MIEIYRCMGLQTLVCIPIAFCCFMALIFSLIDYENSPSKMKTATTLVAGIFLICSMVGILWGH